MGMDCIEGAARGEGAAPVKSTVISPYFKSLSCSYGNTRKGGIMQQANIVEQFLTLYNKIFKNDKKEGGK